MAKITIYSTPTCPYCKMAKEFLTEKKVEFTDVDVAADQKAAEEMIHKSGQMGVPVIIIDKDGPPSVAGEAGKEEIMTGFDKPRLEELLNLK